MRVEALHEKAISRQGNEDLVFSQRTEHLRKTGKKNPRNMNVLIFLFVNSLLSVGCVCVCVCVYNTYYVCVYIYIYIYIYI